MNESGLYIFDEYLYQDIRANGIYENKELKILPNGYKLVYNADTVSEHDIEKINDRIVSFKDFGYYFMDSQGKKHAISYEKGFYYGEYGLWLGGDEGGGFWLKTRREIGGSVDNFFVLRDGEWLKKHKNSL